MNILLTGATGFIGSRVAKHLVTRGHTVIALVRPEPLSSGHELPEGVVKLFVRLDDRETIRRTVLEWRPDSAIHLAWYAHPKDYLSSQENVSSQATSLVLAEALFSAGCRRLLGVGTCLEYSNLSSRRLESDPTDPGSLYAATKLGTYFGCRALATRHGASLAWARVFHVHGPGEHPDRLIPSAIAALRAGRTMEMSPGAQVRDHLHVDDLAAALVEVAMSRLEGPVNACSGQPVTLRQVFETLSEIVAGPGRIVFGARPYAAGEVMFLAGDAGLLGSTGFVPEFKTLRSGLEDVLERLDVRQPSGENRRLP